MYTSRIFFLIAASFFALNVNAFANLDFESAQPPAHDPESIQLLDWSIAAPGWGHSNGDDTSAVYYGVPHVGVSQWFLLTDISPFVLAGHYSLSFKSGYASSMGEGGWINAYIAQTGIIPQDAENIQLLATGPVNVTIGGNSIALTALGNNMYVGNISAYAGLNEELRIINASAIGDSTSITIDNIQFSPVPLPAGLGLFSSSLAGLLIFRKSIRKPKVR
jgi:hypothetical protein